ncbi:hypothetical protein CH252_40595 [Rhodococcus sp. 06-1477-1B]|nr:hypothetical protein CH252_40595 [Rhodococcus sp. 06-1477-1B]
MNATQKIRVDEFFMGELQQIEELSGQSLSVLSDPERPKTKFLTVLGYMSHRRVNPSITLSDVEAMTMADATQYLDLSGDEAE